MQTVHVLQNTLQKVGTSLWQHKIFRLFAYASSAITAISVVRKVHDLMVRKWYKLPPGPCGLPFIGSFLGIVDFVNFYQHLASKYGSVSMFYVGKTKLVMIHDQKLMKSLFSRKEFLNCQGTSVFETKTITDLNGHEWKKRRQLLSSSLIGNPELQSASLNKFITEKCLNDVLYPKLSQNKNEQWFCRNDFEYLCFCVFHNVIFGDPNVLKVDDPTFVKFRNIVKKGNGLLPIAFILNWLFDFSDFGRKMALKYAPLEQRAREMDDIIINKFMPDFNENKEKRNDAYLNVLLQKENDLTIRQISREIQTLIGAGYTTGAALEQSILFAAKYPIQQQRAYDDLKKVFGSKSTAIFDMKKLTQLHEFRAFVYESLRISGSVGSSMPRYIKLTEGIDIGPYHIPENYAVMGDYKSQNMSAVIWKTNGGQMNIDNFLENGKFVNKGNMMTFGTGRRNCAGQALATKILYSVLGNMLLSFQFQMVDADNFDIKKLNYLAPDNKELAVIVKERVE